MADKVNNAKEQEAEKIRRLMEEFDSETFLDEAGDFKYTNPDVKTVIQRDDINYLGSASKNLIQDHQELVNGFNTEDLIALQNLKLSDDEPTVPVVVKPTVPVVDKPTVHMTDVFSPRASSNASRGHAGSRPQGQGYSRHQKNSYQKQNLWTNSPGGYRCQKQNPLQHHHFQKQDGILGNPPPVFEMPYWSPYHPPPPFSNINMSAHHPQSNGVRCEYSSNSLNQNMHSQTFTLQHFQQHGFAMTQHRINSPDWVYK